MKKNCAAVATLITAAVLLFQYLVVHRNHDDNWTAFYYTGRQTQVPNVLAAEDIRRFPTAGYDGQYYHFIAHDPWMTRGFAKFVDNPPLRWRRILVPALAYLLAFGNDDYVDSLYIVVFLGFVWIGTWWSCRFCVQHSRPPVWGAMFLLVPAVLISMDRMTVDVAIAACAAGVLVNPLVALTLAPLARETGLVMIGGCCLYLLLRREWKRAVIYALCSVPALAWFGYVRSQTGPDQTSWIAFPLFGIVQRLMHPEQYATTSRWLAVASRLDYLAVLGVLAALVLSVRIVWNREKGMLETLAITFAAFVTLLSKPDIWSDAFSFGRIVSPLLIFLAMIGAVRRKPIWLLPLLMVLPRVLLQLKATI